MRRTTPIVVISLLAPLALGLPIALDIFIPAMPKLLELLQASVFRWPFLLSLFVLIAGLSQCVIGPLSDSVGRKSVILICCLLYIVSSYLCAKAATIEQLFIARAVQAMGACATLVCALAVIRDYYSGIQAAKAYYYLIACMAFPPLLLPLFDGAMNIEYDWRSAFVFSAVFGVVTALLTFFLYKESLLKRKRRHYRKTILIRFYKMLSQREFVFYTAAASVGLLFLFLFFSNVPDILSLHFQLEGMLYAFAFALMGSSWIIGSMLAASLVSRVGIDNLLLLGITCVSLAGALMAGSHLLLNDSVIGFVLPMFFIGLGATMVLGSGVAGAMEPYARMAGTAAGLLSCLMFVFAFVFGSVLLRWQMLFDWSLSLPAFVVVTVLSLILIGFISIRHKESL